MRYLGLIPMLGVAVFVHCITSVGQERAAIAATPAGPTTQEATPLSLAPAQDPELARQIAEERAARASHRAFYTAPPVIPHALYPASAGDCQTCHKKEAQYFGKTSPVTPHPQLTNCTQCHLPSAPAFEKSGPVTPPETTWQGLSTPTEGTRAHVVAPPVVPHRQFLRESCLTCHSYRSPYVSLRCPHPERSNCAQCHVSAGENEFRLESETELPR